MTHTTRTDKGTTWGVLETVFESIFEVFILCFAGWILARRNLLDKKTQKKLNVLNINLFTPALLFSKVAFFLSPSKLQELWVIPFIFVLVTLTSMATSWGLAKACRLRRSQRSFAMAAAMFMNSNSLPIALMQSLVVTVHGLKWGTDDTRNAMLGRALTYLVLHSTFGMMLRWSFGVRLLAQSDEEGEVVPPPATLHEQADGRDASQSHSKGHEREPLLGSSQRHRDYSSATLRTQSSTAFNTEDENGEPSHSPPLTPAAHQIPALRTALHHGGIANHSGQSDPAVNTDTLGLPAPMIKRPPRPPMVNKQSHFFYSFPNTPQLSSTSLAQSQSDLPDPATQSPPEVPIGTQVTSSLPSFSSRTKTTLRRWGKSTRDFMTPPLYSALFSLFVACLPPLQHLLDVHLLPVKGAINSAGNCSIPITLVVLGGYFWRGDGSEEKTGEGPRPLRTDLPGQLHTAAPSTTRRKTKIGSRSNAIDIRDGEGNMLLGGERVTTEPTRMDGDNAGEGTSRPVSDATLVGVHSTTSTATPTWSRAWLKSRSRAYVKGHAADDEHTTMHNQGNTTGGAATSSNGIPPPATMPAKNLDEHKGESRTVLVAILSRMIITPMILLPLMALVMSKTTMRLFDDPVFVVANVLFISSPPALTLAQITQAASGDAFERLISKTIFWSYCIVTPITTMIYVFIGLELSKL